MRPRHVTMDCADQYALVTFWSNLTGWPISDEDNPGDPEALLLGPGPGARTVAIRVPDGNQS